MVSCVGIAYVSSYSQSTIDKVGMLTEAYHSNLDFSGVVLVAEKGSVVFKKAYGKADREWDIPMTTDTRFKIGSVSKPFTAILILMLVEEGLIQLDGRITDYLPEYEGEMGNSITVHQLLTHTSGILESPDPDQESIAERLYHSLADMAMYAERSPLYFPPGTGFHYSNLAYSLLAYIAERTARMPYDILLEERICRPLGMKSTGQHDASQIQSKLAKGYEYKLLQGFENASWFDPSYARGYGGLISSADDLFKLDQALYDNTLLSNSMIQRMNLPTDRGPYGYGWELDTCITEERNDTLQIAFHTGSINGFAAYVGRIESDSILVVVLKNSRSDTYISPAYAPEIGRNIISILYGDNPSLPKKSIARHLGLIIGRSGVDEAIREYETIKQSEHIHYNLEESELNQLGVELLFRFEMPESALKVFEVNMLEFPTSYNVYDSYAFTFRQLGDYKNAIKYYQMALQVLKAHPVENDSNAVRQYADQATQAITEMQEMLSGMK